MKKRPVVLCSAVSPVLQGLVLQGASPVFCVFSSFESWPLFSSMHLSTEAHLACCRQCLVPSRDVLQFNKVCSGLLDKGDLPPLEVRSYGV